MTRDSSSTAWRRWDMVLGKVRLETRRGRFRFTGSRKSESKVTDYAGSTRTPSPVDAPCTDVENNQDAGELSAELMRLCKGYETDDSSSTAGYYTQHGGTKNYKTGGSPPPRRSSQPRRQPPSRSNSNTPIVPHDPSSPANGATPQTKSSNPADPTEPLRQFCVAGMMANNPDPKAGCIKAVEGEHIYEEEGANGDPVIGNAGGLLAYRTTLELDDMKIRMRKLEELLQRTGQLEKELRDVRDVTAAHGENIQQLNVVTTTHGENIQQLNVVTGDQAREHEGFATRLQDVEESQKELGNLARQRFISTIKRDHPEIAGLDATQEDREIINRGNEAVHGGNIVADMDLWIAAPGSEPQRSDPKVFENIYGITVHEACELVQYDTLMAMLNSRASDIPRDRRVRFPRAYDKAWKAFIKALRKSKFDLTFLEPAQRNNQKDPVAKAWGRFENEQLRWRESNGKHKSMRNRFCSIVQRVP